MWLHRSCVRRTGTPRLEISVAKGSTLADHSRRKIMILYLRESRPHGCQWLVVLRTSVLPRLAAIASFREADGSSYTAWFLREAYGVWPRDFSGCIGFDLAGKLAEDQFL